MAEAAMRLSMKKAGIEGKVDSAGTGAWHIGNAPDERSQTVVMQQCGIDMSGYQARQVKEEDFHKFDYIFAMDEQNFVDLEGIRPIGSKATLNMLLNNGNESPSVADPYYGDISDFEVVWHQVSTASEKIVKQLSGYDQ